MWDKLPPANNLALVLRSSLILGSPSMPVPQVAEEQTAFSSRRVSSFTLLTCSAVSWELCGLWNKAAHTSPLRAIRFLSVQESLARAVLKHGPPTAHAAARSLHTTSVYRAKYVWGAVAVNLNKSNSLCYITNPPRIICLCTRDRFYCHSFQNTVHKEASQF